MTRTNRTTRTRLAQLEAELAKRIPDEPLDVRIRYVLDWPAEAPLRDEDEGVTWIRDWRAEYEEGEASE